MIVELRVENLAIIERCDLLLGPGFTVLTGETGAGKSLIVDALELAFGAKSEANAVRSGESRALVSVTVDLSFEPELAKQCAAMGAEIRDGVLHIEREIVVKGRTQCRIGGKAVPASLLRDVGKLLVDLHGQHDHQSLLDPKSHLGFLDAWIGADALLLSDRVSVLLDKWSELGRKLQSLQGGKRERAQRVDMLEFQVKEIELVAPKAGEIEQLDGQLARLKHAENLYQMVANAKAILGDGDGAGRDQVAGAARLIAEAERMDPSVGRVREALEQATLMLDEAMRDLSDYQDSIEVRPTQLEEIAGRIDEIKKLFRKYGEDEEAVLEFHRRAKSELELLAGDEFSEDDLKKAVTDARCELELACAELTALRKDRAFQFAEFVSTQLQDLAMENAVFDVGFKPKEPDSTGADEVEFLFSANPGEPVRQLSKIASGGEISRVMLAIKTALMGRAGVPTLIFDEVDAGLGGRAAATVARKLEELAEHNQVIVITHLPQIAGRATKHYLVEKQEKAGRAIANARPLNEQDRVEEIGRMIAGEEVGDSALAHARELLLKA
jgi:DNA repair protein RecN (Recombination protein N)